MQNQNEDLLYLTHDDEHFYFSDDLEKGYLISQIFENLPNNYQLNEFKLKPVILSYLEIYDKKIDDNHDDSKETLKFIAISQKEKLKLIQKQIINDLLIEKKPSKSAVDFDPQLSKQIDIHKGIIYSAITIQNDRFLITGGDDAQLRVWCTKNYDLKKSIDTQDQIFSLVNVRNFITAVGLGNDISIYNVSTGQKLIRFRAHDDVVKKIIVLKDMKLCTASWDKSIKIWENNICKKILLGHASNVVSLLYLENGTLVSGSHDKTIKLWCIETGNCLKTLKGHKDDVRCLMSLDSDTFVSGSWDKTIKIWKDDICLKTLKGHGSWVTALLYADGHVISGDENNIKIWKDEDCIKTFKKVHQNFISSILFVNNQLITTSNDSLIKIWEI